MYAHASDHGGGASTVKWSEAYFRKKSEVVIINRIIHTIILKAHVWWFAQGKAGWVTKSCDKADRDESSASESSQ